MPLDLSAGHGDSTAVKQEHFKTVLGTHLATAGAIIAKSKRGGWRHHPKYVYFDLNAGPGIVGGHVGSPLIFLRLATERGIPFEAHFFERDPAAAAALRLNASKLLDDIGRAPESRAIVWVGDSNALVAQAVDQLETRSHRTFGLVYADPNGHQVPVQAITTIAEHPLLQKIDFLVHVAGTAYKRVAGRFKWDIEFSRDIRQAGKKLILIREPIGQWQWTFALMTNWTDMPKFKRIGFYSSDGPDGEAVERRINSPAPKGPRPTRTTPNTSGTRSSWRSERSSSSGLVASASTVAYARRLSHTISGIRPGEPSMSPKTSSRSATNATVSTTESQTEWGSWWCCGGSNLCAACGNSREPGYGNGQVCDCECPEPTSCHECRPDLHPRDTRWDDR